MINAYCYYFGDHGWCRHGRSFFDAWQKQEPIRIIPWDDAPEGFIAPEPGPASPAIGLGPIERVSHIVGSKKIAYVVWETTRMPDDKRSVLRTMDELWTPSTWGRQLLIDNGFEPSNVKVVPEGVDTERFRAVSEPKRNGRFRFLFVGKWEVRKGIADLISAFCQEFEAHELVELVVHGWNPYLPGFNLAANVRRLIGPDSPSVVASQPCDDDGLIDLYNSCDAFVLPTRGEGWGLPITEAMACGLPVVVTQYGAPLDFVDPDCAYFIPVEQMIPAYDPHFFKGEHEYGEWARPDRGSLRRLLRHVFDHQDEAEQKGRTARQRVCSRWTWDHAVTTARRLLAQ
jgi:glycosyltransferase involved in cell wall biosynthesis